jgi:hypothetical protein
MLSKGLLPVDLTGVNAEDLLQEITREITQLHESGAGMRLEIHPATAFAVVAMCQLALRHPGTLTNSSTILVEDFIQYARGKFLPFAPAVAEAIRRGNIPMHDTEPSAT